MKNWVEGEALNKGLWIESYIEKAPKYPSNKAVYRGINDKEAYDYFSNLKVGDTYHAQNLMSTSSSLNQARRFAKETSDSVILVINGRKMGTSIRHLSSMSLENEVLLSGRSNFKVIGKGRDPKGRLVVALETKGVNREWLKKYSVAKKKASIS
jgi:hypothetical protein